MDQKKKKRKNYFGLNDDETCQNLILIKTCKMQLTQYLKGNS